jgi:serine/threonine-protein kinase
MPLSERSLRLSESSIPGAPGPVTLIGRQIAEYEIDRIIGKGATSIVYAAHHVETKAKVAFKVLRPSLANRERDIAQFRKGTSIARFVTKYRPHPNVAATLAEGTLPDGRPYLVMEYLIGETLAERLERAGLTVTAAIDIVTQALAGLGAIHSQGFLHRDLKPANIFLTRTGEVKVLDLGTARSIGGSDEIERFILGTPLYMSPEQASGRDDLDERSDIYAMAAILYECLTGRVSVPDDADEAMRAVASGAIVSLESIAAGELPAGVIAVVDRAMSHNRDGRQRNVKAFIEALIRARPSGIRDLMSRAVGWAARAS